MGAMGAVLLFLLSTSCTNKGRYVSATEMWSMARASGEEVELVAVPNSSPHRRVLCRHYEAPGCVPSSGRRIKVRMVEFLAIQFKTEAQARAAALKYRQYYFANWLFDEVTNEPVVEHFLKQYFGAINPHLEVSSR